MDLKNLSKNLPKNPNELLKNLPNFNPSNLVGVGATPVKEFTDEELTKIKNMINDVFKERFSPQLITQRIDLFIEKLGMNEQNIESVKQTMMNLIFSDINILLSNKKVKYEFILKLLESPDINKIVSDPNFDINKFKETLISPIESPVKNQPLDTNNENSVNENSVNENSVNENSVNESSVNENSVNENSVNNPVNGGASTLADCTTCSKDVFYAKICRLLDVEISDEEIMNLFMNYISDFFKKESPEKQEIFKTMVAKTKGFIDQLFQNINPRFDKYLLYSLLDANVIQIISNEFKKVENSKPNNEIIKTALNNDLLKKTSMGGRRKSKKTRKRLVLKSRSKKTLRK